MYEYDKPIENEKQIEIDQDLRAESKQLIFSFQNARDKSS